MMNSNALARFPIIPQKIPLRRSAKPARPKITPEILRNQDLGCGRYALGRPFIGPIWYCAAIHPVSLHVIVAALQRQQIRTHLPLFQPENQPDPASPTWRPLFPGYVLVNFDHAPIWQRIFSTFGIKRFFMTDEGHPNPIKPLMLQYIDLASRMTGSQPTAPPKRPSFKPGEEVIIQSGPLTQFHALVKLSDADRTTVFLQMMGRTMAQEFSTSALRRAPAIA